jgi:hyperosmotically inducible protein
MAFHFDSASRAAILVGAVALSLGACSKPAEPAAPPTPVPAAAAPAQVEDVDVTTHVQTALLADGLLKGLTITVVTTKGDVRLSGEVGSQEQLDRAYAVAHLIEGVHALHNDLVVKK